MGKTRIAVVDDHPLVLCGILKTLESADFDVLGAVTSPAQLLQLLSDEPCDVVVSDYSMPGDQTLDGWRFLATVSSQFPDTRVLVYTEFDDPFLVGSLVQRGVAGIVSKRDEMHEVLAATRALANGGRYLSPIAHASLERFGTLPEYKRFMALTRRQMEVTGLMLCGLTVCETARLLHRRVNTISAQRSEACRRLGFSGESEMYRFAVGHGLWLDRSMAGSELRPA
ncbi:response regulator transcription factor [Caballeronia sp. LZ062]|uniref:response regulator transcription factor n=1 Tax=unclassified Caballeronia TaxID=2646786 RepID=UPI002865E443|nr:MULTISPECIES: response regulator transcription factor [unclassified Caballeronia]MDR5856421.1 response regulator transcription factor [Caballeronia sp. LZ050]MDR5873091.1 response regulator transcription factor [Caballeronia sp. LZ062]